MPANSVVRSWSKSHYRSHSGPALASSRSWSTDSSVWTRKSRSYSRWTIWRRPAAYPTTYQGSNSNSNSNSSKNNRSSSRDHWPRWWPGMPGRRRSLWKTTIQCRPSPMRKSALGPNWNSYTPGWSLWSSVRSASSLSRHRFTSAAAVIW